MKEKYDVQAILDDLKSAEEMNPDLHDGCYRLMHETIKAYAKLADYSILDYRDMGFHEIEFADRFDGIWACASLLHVPEKELENVLAIFHRALKRDGVLYASWKYGEAERSDGARFYCDMTEEKLRRVLARVNLKAREGLEACEGLKAREGLFDCLECWVAEDSLPSGREQKWLNVVLGKKVILI